MVASVRYLTPTLTLTPSPPKVEGLWECWQTGRAFVPGDLSRRTQRAEWPLSLTSTFSCSAKLA